MVPLSAHDNNPSIIVTGGGVLAYQYSAHGFKAQDEEARDGNLCSKGGGRIK